LPWKPNAVDHLKRSRQITLGQRCDETLDIHMQWAGFHAGRMLAIQAAKGFCLNLLQRQALANLFVTSQTPFHRQQHRLLPGRFRVSLDRLRHSEATGTVLLSH
jgi:hypothetical protein